MSATFANPVSERQPAASLPYLRTWYWLVRREIWEHRSLWIAPLATAGVFFAGFLIRLPLLPAKVRSLAALSPMDRHTDVGFPFHIAAGLLMVTAMITGGFYCVDAMQGERRDRSILFWKSLPVSDLESVLAKASIPLVIMPLLTLAITSALQLLMLAASAFALLLSGIEIRPLLAEVSFPRMTMMLFYHWITIHSLYNAPLYAWLLFVSAWARRAALVWALLPPVMIATMERLLFGTSRFVDMLSDRLGGLGEEAHTIPGTFPMDPMTHPTLATYLVSPGLWTGLAVTAILIVASAWLRRRRSLSV